MKNVVTNLYPEYLRYIDSFRAIPWKIDALKPVERRLLLTVHELAKNKFTKSAKIVGGALSKYHPHGDLSAYETLVSLVNRGLVTGQGNWGAAGLEDMNSAAQRYTEAKSNKLLDDLFSEFLKFAPWKELELDAEPLFLPSPIPIGLVGEGIILGIGNNITRVPRYNFKDLIIRSNELITNSPTKTTIIPKISNCDIYEDSAGEFEKILTTGEGVIQCIPIHRTVQDKIIILGRNPLFGFSKLKSYNIEHEEKNGSPAYNLVDLSKDKLCVQVSPYRGPVTKDFELLIAKLISTRINIKCNFVDTNFSVKTFPIDEILISSYNHWKDCYLISLQTDLNKLKEKEFEYKVLQITRNIYLKNPNVKTISDICKIYSTQKIPGIEVQDIETVSSKYSFKKVVESDIDIPAILNEINIIIQNINNIDTLASKRLNSIF
jgi:DNA gyrase/topoisomerase IV subunit A